MPYNLFKRELILLFRHPSEWLQPGVFYGVLLILLPLSIDPDPELLKQLAPGWIWLGLLLANIMGMNRLFHRDAQEGTLEQFKLGPIALITYVNIKLFTHWLGLILPLILLIPISGLLFNLSLDTLGYLLLSLLCGSPALTCLIALGAVLMLLSRQQAVLASLFILPLTIPILIFGSGGAWLLVLAMSVFLITLLPWVIVSLFRFVEI